MRRPGPYLKKTDTKEASSMRQLCYRCFRPLKNCLCSDIEAIRTHTRFVILMHPKEARKVKLGTGRLTHICLKNSVILEGVDFSQDRTINRLIGDKDYYPVVLYPGENSTDISEFPFPGGVPDKKRVLVIVIDASWTLARKMLNLSANLQTLPKIRMRPQEPSRYVIKKQPHEYCLSTIESVYYLIQELGELGIEERDRRHRSMLGLLDKMCRLQQEYTNDANIPGYRKRTVTPGEIRWPNVHRCPGKRQKRSVCFD